MKDQAVYLRDLIQRLDMIRAFTSEGYSDFINSLKTQESVFRCFEVIGEIIKRLDPELLARYPEVPWKQIARFRDILIHQYDKVDLEIVWSTIQHDLTPLRSAVETLLKSLE